MTGFTVIKCHCEILSKTEWKTKPRLGRKFATRSLWWRKIRNRLGAKWKIILTLSGNIQNLFTLGDMLCDIENLKLLGLWALHVFSCQPTDLVCARCKDVCGHILLPLVFTFQSWLSWFTTRSRTSILTVRFHYRLKSTINWLSKNCSLLAHPGELLQNWLNWIKLHTYLKTYLYILIASISLIFYPYIFGSGRKDVHFAESWIFILFSWISSSQTRQVDFKSTGPLVRSGRHWWAAKC